MGESRPCWERNQNFKPPNFRTWPSASLSKRRGRSSPIFRCCWISNMDAKRRKSLRFALRSNKIRCKMLEMPHTYEHLSSCEKTHITDITAGWLSLHWRFLSHTAISSHYQEPTAKWHPACPQMSSSFLKKPSFGLEKTFKRESWLCPDYIITEGEGSLLAQLGGALCFFILFKFWAIAAWKAHPVFLHRLL